ncbi:protein NASP homolog [Anopheles maculipalpis]|uniref:protein NASP homolog n=1 Tax=Anopheles maculipalpis TaxID=1496333 RepID=UPI002159267E|nr:protein NASP homolog [Anopheles maculipalpis]
MAEKSETLVTKDERINEAKELFGRGSRNYCMKQYADAADDLSECCSIYSELYGPSAEQLGLPYLMYAKSLIALGKDENNLIVAEEAEDDGEEDDDDDEEEEEAAAADENEGGENGDGEKKKEQPETEVKENVDEPMDTKEKSDEDATAAEKDNESKDKAGKAESAEAAPGSSEPKEENGEPQPGPSTSNGTGNTAQEEAAENLQVAWEILELAVNIFQQQGEKGLENLPECYMELAGISFENSFFKEATNDYVKALEIYKKTEQLDRRLLAEVNYKVGLCYMMEREFEESIKSFKGAVAELEKVVEQEKAKEQTDDIKETILDLEDMKMEILEKITDVEDAMKTPIEDVKRELSKIIVSGGESNGKDLNNGAGPSSSSAAGSSSNGTASKSSGVAAKPANDISHLIKRKKPDTASPEVEGSPAKKTASESENVASHNTSA